ncbi:uncharacterized protein LOC124456317 isoform X2 [Xenia sp. Carnegie-2017]|uniref:uncharacterized protein LOC124456317 isoform X2 n=1 Tax=Xenia sp. Carnegie-2017 TaxID=2897299 RepID=UPI001F041735|nr:uncharacterized protein LOC124456317 isoform X2 [Xenia sp. Carnegie-2017]
MMRCAPNCRDLTVLDCAWSAKDLRANLGGGQGKIYLRPIQMSLSKEPLVQQSQSEVKEQCKMCNQEILVRRLRNHLWSCMEGLDTSDEDGQDAEPGQFAHEESREFVISGQAPSSSNSLMSLPASSEASLSYTKTETIASVPTTLQMSSEVIDPTVKESEISHMDKIVDDIVNDTVAYCEQYNVLSAVEILRCFQKKMVTGRDLEVQALDEVNEGDTNFIMIDRGNVLKTALDEILCLTDYRKTLQVEFYGEVAVDQGGPRKEFFRLVLKEIEKFFDNGLRNLLSEQYVGVGILLGLSIIQNGKIPTFIGDLCGTIFSSEQTSEPCITELRGGLKKVGIFQGQILKICCLFGLGVIYFLQMVQSCISKLTEQKIAICCQKVELVFIC